MSGVVARVARSASRKGPATWAADSVTLHACCLTTIRSMYTHVHIAHICRDYARPGYLYVMASPEFSGLVKIGISTTPEKRARQVNAILVSKSQTAHMAKAERRVHHIFASRHSPILKQSSVIKSGHSEWYAVERDVAVRFVEEAAIETREATDMYYVPNYDMSPPVEYESTYKPDTIRYIQRVYGNDFIDESCINPFPWGSAANTGAIALQHNWNIDEAICIHKYFKRPPFRLSYAPELDGTVIAASIQRGEHSWNIHFPNRPRCPKSLHVSNSCRSFKWLSEERR